MLRNRTWVPVQELHISNPALAASAAARHPREILQFRKSAPATHLRRCMTLVLALGLRPHLTLGVNSATSETRSPAWCFNLKTHLRSIASVARSSKWREPFRRTRAPCSWATAGVFRAPNGWPGKRVKYGQEQAIWWIHQCNCVFEALNGNPIWRSNGACIAGRSFTPANHLMMHNLTTSLADAIILNMALETSPLKTLLLGGLAVVSVIIAIVVAVKTFSNPSSPLVVESTAPITGLWTRKGVAEVPEVVPEVPVDYLVGRGVASFDASTASTGTVKVTFADGRAVDCRVLFSGPGYLQLQVPLKGGVFSHMTIYQTGDGGPTFIVDGTSSWEFESSK